MYILPFYYSFPAYFSLYYWSLIKNSSHGLASASLLVSMFSMLQNLPPVLNYCILLPLLFVPHAVSGCWGGGDLSMFFRDSIVLSPLAFVHPLLINLLNYYTFVIFHDVLSMPLLGSLFVSPRVVMFL